MLNIDIDRYLYPIGARITYIRRALFSTHKRKAYSYTLFDL